MNPYEQYATAISRLRLILSLRDRIERLEEKIVSQRTINIDIDWKNCEPWELGGC